MLAQNNIAQFRLIQQQPAQLMRFYQHQFHPRQQQDYCQTDIGAELHPILHGDLHP